MNSGRILSKPRSDEVNILLFTEIEKDNYCFSIYSLSDLNNIFCGLIFVFSSTASSWIFNISTSLKVAKREFTPAILFCLDHALFTPLGVNNAQLLRDSEPIRLLETPRSLSEYWYILIKIIVLVILISFN